MSQDEIEAVIIQLEAFDDTFLRRRKKYLGGRPK